MFKLSRFGRNTADVLSALLIMQDYDVNLICVVMHVIEKKILLDKLSYDKTFSMICRVIINGNTEHVRYIFIMCEDNEHILCCLERIEEEIRTKKEQERDLQFAKRKASAIQNTL